MGFFTRFNKGTKETFNSIEEIIAHARMSAQVKADLQNMRKGINMVGRYKAYVTVTKNPDMEDEQVLCQTVPNQLQNGGRDDMHNALFENQGAATQLGFTHMSVSTNASGLPADAATTLLGEITSGGLDRADADTTTHAAGTATTLVEHTYTADGTETDVQKGALWDGDAATDTMGIVYLFTAATLVSGDTLKVSVTITLND